VLTFQLKAVGFGIAAGVLAVAALMLLDANAAQWTTTIEAAQGAPYTTRFICF
jgi:hypothetical protein